MQAALWAGADTESTYLLMLAADAGCRCLSQGERLAGVAGSEFHPVLTSEGTLI